MPTERDQAETVLPVSPLRLALFMAYLRWYLPNHFHSLRIAHAERFPAHASPLIVCINHPSWWDPLAILMVSRYLAPDRFAYAPMEAVALEHYGFFRHLGAFPVDNRSPRAAAQFLRRAKSVVAREKAVLWMTPEGHFMDARTRPVQWKPGAAAITRYLDVCTVVPLAIEYTFWDERLPEIFCSVGKPLSFSHRDTASADERTAELQTAMTATQDGLAERVQQRQAALFTTIFSGNAGVSAAYNLWHRLRAAMHGKSYVGEHGAIAPK